jgi:hypothetical protein
MLVASIDGQARALRLDGGQLRIADRNIAILLVSEFLIQGHHQP